MPRLFCQCSGAGLAYEKCVALYFRATGCGHAICTHGGLIRRPVDRSPVAKEATVAIDFISPKAHAFLDYASVAAQAAAPRLVDLDRGAARIHKAALTATTGYSLLTDYPGGVCKVLPMRMHLAIDALLGAGFLAAAVARRRNRSAFWMLTGMGLLSLTAALCTKARRAARPSGQTTLRRSELPMHRYARDRNGKSAESPQIWPDFLRRQVARRQVAPAPLAAV